MIRINLLPYRNARRLAELRYFFIKLVASVVFGVALGLLGYIFFSDRVVDQQRANSMIEARIKDQTESLAQVEKIKKQVEILKEERDHLISLLSAREVPIAFLEQLAVNLPQGIVVRRLTISDSVFQVDGFSLYSDLIADAKDQLLKSSAFSSVTIAFSKESKFTDSSGTTKEGFDFLISGKVNSTSSSAYISPL